MDEAGELKMEMCAMLAEPVKIWLVIRNAAAVVSVMYTI